MLLIHMCEVKIVEVVQYPVRIQTSLLSVVPRSDGTASESFGVY